MVISSLVKHVCNPPAISTVFSFHRILWTTIISISNIKSPFLATSIKIHSETLIQIFWNWPFLLCFCLYANITQLQYNTSAHEVLSYRDMFRQFSIRSSVNLGVVIPNKWTVDNWCNYFLHIWCRIKV